MKVTAILCVALLGCLATAKGQDLKGEMFWVVETHPNEINNSLVRIYDASNTLLHEVKLDRRLDVTNRKHRRVLVQILKRYSDRAGAAGKKTRLKSMV